MLNKKLIVLIKNILMLVDAAFLEDKSQDLLDLKDYKSLKVFKVQLGLQEIMLILLLVFV